MSATTEHKRKRGENWSSEEKEILRQVIAQSAHIIEDKSTKSSINKLKTKEWKNISIRFNKITGKCRSDGELKLAWKRMKLSAKLNLSRHRKEQLKTGGGAKPQSPSPEDIEIIITTSNDSTKEKESAKMVTLKNDETVATRAAKKRRNSSQNRSEDMRQSIVKSNADLKKRHLEMMEVEHQYNIKIAQLKIKKLELEIALLESKKKN